MDYAERILAKLYGSEPDEEGWFELRHGDVLDADRRVELDADEASWLTEFMNRLYAARD